MTPEHSAESVRLVSGFCAFRAHEWCKDVPVALTGCQCPCHPPDGSKGWTVEGPVPSPSGADLNDGQEGSSVGGEDGRRTHPPRTHIDGCIRCHRPFSDERPFVYGGICTDCWVEDDGADVTEIGTWTEQYDGDVDDQES